MGHCVLGQFTVHGNGNLPELFWVRTLINFLGLSKSRLSRISTIDTCTSPYANVGKAQTGHTCGFDLSTEIYKFTLSH
jgi:hypothetical protein